MIANNERALGLEEIKHDRDALMAQRAKIIDTLIKLMENLDISEREVGVKSPNQPHQLEAWTSRRNQSYSRFGIRKRDMNRGKIDGCECTQKADKTGKPQSFILSYRGIQLTKELFAIYASSTQGMSWRDFRTYLGDLGRPYNADSKSTIYDQASWQDYLCTIENNGEYMSNSMVMTEDGFLRHRNSIEKENPLEEDLESLGLDLLPMDLIVWQRMKQFLEKESFLEVNNNTLHKQTKSNVNIRVMQQALSGCGEIYSLQQIQNFIDRHDNFVPVMSQLMSKHWWKSQQYSPYFINEVLSTQGLNNEKNTSNSSFIAWFMSGRYRPSLQDVERVLISAKTSMMSCFKTIVSRMSSFHSAIENIIDLQILDMRYLSSVKDKVSTFEGKLQVGKKKNKNDRRIHDSLSSSLNIELKHIDHANKFLRSLGMPRGVGTSLIIDLPIRNSAITKEEMEQMTRLVTNIFKQNLEESVSDLPYFHSWKIFHLQNEDQKSRVLRVGVSWETPTNIDLVLNQLGLDFSIPNILKEIKCNISCSHGVDDLLTDQNLVIESDVLLLGSFSFKIGRELIVSVISEMLHQVKEKYEIFTTQVTEEYDALNRRIARTKESRPDCPENVLCSIVQSVMNNSDNEYNYKTYRKRVIQMRNVKKSWKFINILKNLKGSYMEFASPSLKELLFENKVMICSPKIKMLFSTKGALACYFKKVLQKVETETNGIQQQDILEGGRRRKAELKRQQQQQKKDTLKHVDRAALLSNKTNTHNKEELSTKKNGQAKVQSDDCENKWGDNSSSNKESTDERQTNDPTPNTNAELLKLVFKAMLKFEAKGGKDENLPKKEALKIQLLNGKTLLEASLTS